MDWYYAEAGQQRGPVNEAELQNLVRAGTIRGDTLVWHEGMVNWQPYREVASPTGGLAMPSLAPPLTGYSSPEGARQVALDKVKGPAIGLIVTAVLGLLGALAALVMSFFSKSGGNFMPPGMTSTPDIQRVFETIGPWLGVINFVNVLFMFALSGLVLVGGLRMQKLRSYGLVVAASIVSLLPCVSIGCVPCCIVGLPIGIWALVVLNKPEVKSQFQ